MRELTVKISEKGAVSVYGLNSKFPVSLYPNQWEALLAKSTGILDFISKNKTELDKKVASHTKAKPADGRVYL